MKNQLLGISLFVNIISLISLTIVIALLYYLKILN